MSRILKSTLMVIVALACSFEMVQAEPIVYTLSGTGSGSIGGSMFTDEAFTITANADTTNVMQNYGGGANSYVTTNNFTIAINGHTMAIGMSETLAIASSPGNASSYGNPGNPAELAFTNANYTMSPNVILGLAGSDVGSYNLTGSFTSNGADSPFGVFNGTAASGILTNEGRFLLSGTSSGVTFTASDTAAAVPEPSSLAMVALGLAGVGVVARRRKARTSITA